MSKKKLAFLDAGSSGRSFLAVTVMITSTAARVISPPAPSSLLPLTVTARLPGSTICPSPAAVTPLGKSLSEVIGSPGDSLRESTRSASPSVLGKELRGTASGS
jgi:hypothetical protein